MNLLVFGNPVEHSLSPVIMQAALDHFQIDGSYTRRRVDEAGMAKGVQEIRSGLLQGANVTMPHKARAARLADQLTPTAQKCGVANTLWHQDGQVWGHTTDPDGVRFAGEKAQLPTDAPVLVLGAGGAAVAALVALEGRELFVSARRREAAEDRAKGPVDGVAVVEWGQGVSGAVVVNATPLGLKGERLPEPVVDGAAGLLEMNYGHGPTPAFLAMQAKGCPVAPGELMLVGQAISSFRIWAGRSVPPEVMLAGLADAGRGIGGSPA